MEKLKMRVPELNELFELKNETFNSKNSLIKNKYFWPALIGFSCIVTGIIILFAQRAKSLRENNE
jgi:hypothetical protein